MKRFLSLALCAALLIVFTGCTQTQTQATASPTASATAEPTESPETTDEAEETTEPTETTETTETTDPEASATPEETAASTQVEQVGSYGYTLTFDSTLFTFAAEEGADRYALIQEDGAQGQATCLTVSQLAAADIESYESEKMAEGKQETTLGTGAYAANTAQATETDEDGVTVTYSYYTVALESGDALAIEVVQVGSDQADALQAMLDSLTLS